MNLNNKKGPPINAPTCSVCGKIFNSAQGLGMHLRSCKKKEMKKRESLKKKGKRKRKRSYTDSSGRSSRSSNQSKKLSKSSVALLPTCEYCGNFFSNAQGLGMHRKHCKKRI